MENISTFGDPGDMQFTTHPDGAYTYKSLLGQPPPCLPITITMTKTVNNVAGIQETQQVEFFTYRRRDDA